MSKQKVAGASAAATNGELTKLLKQYGCGPIQFTGDANALIGHRFALGHELRHGQIVDRSGARGRVHEVADRPREQHPAEQKSMLAFHRDSGKLTERACHGKQAVGC